MRFVACAPGRLSVMGGIAEYTGGLVVNMTKGGHVCVGVQRRTDDRVVILDSSCGPDGLRPVATSSTAELVRPDAIASLSVEPGNRNESARSVLGAIAELLRSGVSFDADQEGLTVSIDSNLDELSDAGGCAAMAAATIAAVAAAIGAAVSPQKSVELCHRVENDWLGAPVGFGDATNALLGEQDALVKISCDRWSFANLPWPSDEVEVVGLDSGVAHDVDLDRYRRVRTATSIGTELIRRILEHEPTGHEVWDGHLSRFSVSDFATRFRDRIPTKMTGKTFLDRFGQTGDPLAPVEPATTYKVRSRTEHHIYENARAVRFCECLNAGNGSVQTELLREAGELMYASHWSYGQRCGLGSVETDKLVSLIRQHGVDNDILGAKIAGRGCGGSVAVLLRKTPRARASLEAAIVEYEKSTTNSCRWLSGSFAGALTGSIRKIPTA
jgi:galactokinase